MGKPVGGTVARSRSQAMNASLAERSRSVLTAQSLDDLADRCATRCSSRRATNTVGQHGLGAEALDDASARVGVVTLSAHIDADAAG